MQERKRKKKIRLYKIKLFKILTRPVRAPSQILKFDKDSNN